MDLPTIVYTNGDMVWRKNGEIHRDNDLPAIVFANGDKWWICNGKFYREHGRPVIEYIDDDLGETRKQLDLESLQISVPSVAPK